MGEISNYTELDLYNQSPATVGKQNQIINALNSTVDTPTPGESDIVDAINDLASGISVEITGRDEILDASINLSDNVATQTVVAGIAGKKIRVIGWYVGASVASGTYQWYSNVTVKTGLIPVGINGGGAPNIQFTCGTGEDLKMLVTTADIDGLVNYVLVDV